MVEAPLACLAKASHWAAAWAVARAMQRVLVGKRPGRLTPGTPRSGLAPHMGRCWPSYGFLGRADARPVEVRRDPLRSRLNRRQVVAVPRLTACGIAHAEPLGAEREAPCSPDNRPVSRA